MSPATEPLLPLWVVLPLAGLAMGAVILHAWMMTQTAMPASRRRIRTANAALALVLIPVLAVAFGWATTARPALWAMAWVASVGLLSMTIMLALLDSLNSFRIHRSEYRVARARLEALRLEAAGLVDRRGEAAGS